MVWTEFEKRSIVFLAVKCVWKEWTQWHSCSVTCGVGTEIRTRKPISAYYEGLNCQGPSEESRPCYQDACSGN